MASRTKRTVCVHLFLLMTNILPQAYCQQGFVNGMIRPKATTFKNTNSVYPVNAFNSYAYPVGKGYYPMSAINTYYTHPVNAQYWTGQQPHYMQYQQHPQYSNWQYPGQYQYNPQQYGYYPQQYGYGHHQTGYSNYYGQYPNFDAQYWMGNYHPMSMSPAYMHPVQMAPMYIHKPMYYQAHPMMYNSHYPYHAVPYPAYPHHRNRYDRGFLGGTGELTKGLLGAILFGAIAGKVARG